MNRGGVPTATAPNPPGWDVTDPTAAPQSAWRSYLSVFGQTGILPAAPAWTDISVVTHKNQDIDGNVLAAMSFNSQPVRRP